MNYTEFKEINILYNNKFQLGNLSISDGKIKKIEFLGEENKSKDYVIPGLIDVHTHGAMNFDFNTINSKEDIKCICFK